MSFICYSYKRESRAQKDVNGLSFGGGPFENNPHLVTWLTVYMDKRNERFSIRSLSLHLQQGHPWQIVLKVHY